MKDILIDLKNKSFVKVDDAVDMCGLLKSETGLDYSVIADNLLGFTYKRVENNPTIISNKSKNYFRPALRGFIPHYIQIMLGLFFTTESELMIDLFFRLLNIDPIPNWINPINWEKGFKILGLCMSLYGVRFIYSYFASMLLFEEDGVVLKTGIIAQNQIQIRYGDIKTIGVNQSILERILGIGTLELDSAGTDGVDIRFHRIINPTKERKNIQTIIDNHI